MNDPLGLAGRALLLSLANAQNRYDTIANRRLDFVANLFQCFMKINSARRMTDNAIVDQLPQHRKANFAGVSALVFIKGILRSQPELPAINLQTYRL